MNQSDDYKRGWYDGYNAARQHNPLFPQPLPFTPSPINKPNLQCSKCGMKWEGIIGYVCPVSDCPIQPKITSTSNQETL